MIESAPTLIASYPRSGSTWLRFILCNLFYPEFTHDFDSVNRHIPGLDDPVGVMAGVSFPRFYKTHKMRNATNVLFLHRHVGDVLESEWWYKRKFHDDHRSLKEFVEATDYGQEWRAFTEFYFPARHQLAYHDLGEPIPIHSLFPQFSHTGVTSALKQCTFEKMQMAEQRGFGIYPQGDLQIRFIRSGKSGQWREWSPGMQNALLEKNKVQLKMLGYDEKL